MCRFVTERGHLAPLPPQVTLVRREIPRERSAAEKVAGESAEKSVGKLGKEDRGLSRAGRREPASSRTGT
jgi:hypothetical protein